MAALGIEVVEIELHGEPYLHAAHIVAADAEKPLKGVLFASPANPTGANIPDNELKAIVEACRERDVMVISDEIYHKLSYMVLMLLPSGSGQNMRHQFILQILLHDRLAHRLDGFAKSACASGGADRAKPVHFSARAVTTGGMRSF